MLNRKNILVAGSTGAGKTSLLNAMVRLIPDDERLLLIEDTAEIQVHHLNLVRLEARPPQNGVPAVGIRDLLKAALRHRPDRIGVGLQLHERRIAACFVKLVHVGALQVFDQLQFEALRVGELADAGGNGFTPGELRGAVAPRSGHEFKPVRFAAR